MEEGTRRSDPDRPRRGISARAAGGRKNLELDEMNPRHIWTHNLDRVSLLCRCCMLVDCVTIQEHSDPEASSRPIPDLKAPRDRPSGLRFGGPGIWRPAGTQGQDDIGTKKRRSLRLHDFGLPRARSRLRAVVSLLLLSADTADQLLRNELSRQFSPIRPGPVMQRAIADSSEGALWATRRSARMDRRGCDPRCGRVRPSG
jgi:hypothetical protein